MSRKTQVAGFGFGRNWQRFVEKHFNEERVEISRRHILGFLQVDNLQGKDFLDIGCGSGLHSLAALRSGAAGVISFDADPDSVMTTRKLREYAGSPAHWQVLHGSILDKAFLDAVPPADIVYSWGVLHHTGDMWQAMDNTARLMKDTSALYVALYDYDIRVRPSAEFWLKVKRRYNRTGWLGKRCIESGYILGSTLYGLLRNPVLCAKQIFRHNEGRGMSFYTDVVDWLGGWPMEFARRADVSAWAQRNNLAMLTMKTGEANTEYLFRRQH